jgi:hypothetical protein
VSYIKTFPTTVHPKRLDRTNGSWTQLIRGMELEVVAQFLSEVDETVEKLKASRGN